MRELEGQFEGTEDEFKGPVYFGYLFKNIPRILNISGHPDNDEIKFIFLKYLKSLIRYLNSMKTIFHHSTMPQVFSLDVAQISFHFGKIKD